MEDVDGYDDFDILKHRLITISSAKMIPIKTILSVVY